MHNASNSKVRDASVATNSASQLTKPSIEPWPFCMYTHMGITLVQCGRITALKIHTPRNLRVLIAKLLYEVTLQWHREYGKVFALTIQSFDIFIIM